MARQAVSLFQFPSGRLDWRMRNVHLVSPLDLVCIISKEGNSGESFRLADVFRRGDLIMVIYGLSAHYGEARYGEQTA
jgi:hypothetical protein